MPPKSGDSVRQRYKPSSTPATTPRKLPLVPACVVSYIPADTATSKARPQQPPSHPLLQLDSRAAFYILLASHTLAALFHPIQDCDEVFNYWEPTHYLNHGHGFQTWEYSPEYAIRSWAYTSLHALVTLPLKLAGGSKAAEFYCLRIFLGFICALCETRLYSKTAATLNPRIAIGLLLVLATSPGMFHASIAYLPSSFAMYFSSLGIAAFMDWRGGLRTAQGTWMFGVGACLGWPFAAAMSAPFLLEELFLASISDRKGMIDLFWRVVDGVMRTLLTLALQVGLDWFFYKRLVFVPLNIVLYNVFSSKGPELYGTEPWHFYIRNLFLNFHVWLPLAMLALPLLLAQKLLRVKAATKASYLRGIVFLSPFYLWLAIFTLQPHKEERFMYPAYPALALNAAVSLHIILANLGSTDPKDLISRIPVQLRLAGAVLFVGSSLVLSILRTVGTITAYSAPLSIYEPLHDPATGARVGDNICLGKEWYRFPSHYLLPSGTRAKLIRSEFSGLLPGAFSEVPAAQGFGLFPGTWLVPYGMNDDNLEDPSKYTDLKRCDWLVDSHLTSTDTTALVPHYASNEKDWERVRCLPFLDAASTGVVGRTLWIPDLPFVPEKYKRVWGEYCLLKRRTKTGSEKVGGRMDGVPGIEHLS